MSLVDLFFNGDYRESLQRESEQEARRDNTHVTSDKDIRKIRRDYHLNRMQSRVNLLSSEVVYGFIDTKSITEKAFSSFLAADNAQDWTHPVLWARFKETHSFIK